MRILIIGLGSIAKKHVKALASLRPDAEIIALRSSRTSESYPGVRSIYDWNEIASLKIDFAIIANPSSEHKRTIQQLIPHGFPLFIEKPLHATLEVESLVESIGRGNILTYVACNLRFLDCIRFIRENIQSGKQKKLNEVNVYCGSYLPEWRPDQDYKKSYSADPDLGGGVHIDLIHELDYLYWLFGQPRATNRFLKKGLSLSIPVVDYANYLFDYDGFAANVILNYYRRDSKRTLELVFSDETWSVDLLRNEVTSNGQVLFSSNQLIGDTYHAQMKYFIDCFEQKSATHNPVSVAYTVLKMCLEK